MTRSIKKKQLRTYESIDVRYETCGNDDETMNLYATAVSSSVRVIDSRSAVVTRLPSASTAPALRPARKVSIASGSATFTT